MRFTNKQRIKTIFLVRKSLFMMAPREYHFTGIISKKLKRTLKLGQIGKASVLI